MKPNKYVRFDNGLNDVIVIFPNFVEHSTVSIPGTAVSAGFIDFDPVGGLHSCWGESVSMGLSAHPDDSKFAQKQFPVV
jgi:hypothetical protein